MIVVGLWLVTPATGHAQGNSNGNGNGNGRPKVPKADKPAPSPSPAPAPSSGSSSTSTTAPAPTPDTLAGVSPEVFTPISTYRQFGSWLDDASAAAAGEAQTSVGIGHWRMTGMSQTNFPMIGMGIGLTDRLQVSASLPFYRANYDGEVVRGLDDIYLSAKYVLIDPTLTLSEVGLSVSPVVEVLSPGAIDGRVHFALPVNVEIRRLPFRVYGSGGYFTRGSVFGGGAVEWTSPSRLTFTGSLSQSYSIRSDAALDALGIGARRADVTGSVAVPIGQVAVGYASVGRSLTRLEEGGTSLSLAGGVAFRFNAAGARP
jgi:hypothetical protein